MSEALLIGGPCDGQTITDVKDHIKEIQTFAPAPSRFFPYRRVKYVDTGRLSNQQKRIFQWHYKKRI